MARVGKKTDTKFKLESLGQKDCLGGEGKKYGSERECKCMDKIQHGKYQ